MEKERKDLFLNGASVLAIEKYNKQIHFLTVTPDGEGMREVSCVEFLEELKSLAFVFATSWNKEIINDYRAFYEYYRKVVQ